MEHLSQFIINHWQLWLAFIGVLALIFINELLSKKTEELDPQAVITLINNENASLIDLREKEAYLKGHIIGSIHVNAQDFELEKMNKYKNKPIILVCARGLQSATVAAKIRSQGYQPSVLRGGIAAWQSADLPLVKGK
jgi:rhodanese-related sulfurtransferase